VGGRNRATTSQSRGATLSSSQHGPQVTVPGSTLQAADSHQIEVAPEISFESGRVTVTHRTSRRRGPSGKEQFNTGISLLSRSCGLVERIRARCSSGNVKWLSRSGSASASSRATADMRGSNMAMTRVHWSRAEASSGCSKTIRIADATMLRAERGTRSWALRVT